MDDNLQIVTSVDDIQVVILDEEPITIIETEAQGPPGSVTRLSAVAGEDLPPYRIIRSGAGGVVFLADGTVDEGHLIGTTTAPALMGETVFYVTCGIEIPFSGAVPGTRYYLGGSGEFTNTVPVDGLLVWAGLCVNPDMLLLQPLMPVIRRRVWE